MVCLFFILFVEISNSNVIARVFFGLDYMKDHPEAGKGEVDAAWKAVDEATKAVLVIIFFVLRVFRSIDVLFWPQYEARSKQAKKDAKTAQSPPVQV
jgi:hypothetical protein